MEHQTDGDIATLSVTALKALITSAGLSYAGCVEKSDLRERAADARRARNAPRQRDAVEERVSPRRRRRDSVYMIFLLHTACARPAGGEVPMPARQ